MQEAVLVDLSDGVMTLTLNRPTKRNAINGAVLEGLASALERAKADSGTRVVVVGGAGGYFSAGIDLSFAVDSKMPRLDFMRMVGDVVVALHELRVPTVSVVEGGAYGLGCNIALACDLTIATDDAVFCEVFSRLGFVIDGGGSWLLPRLVGLKKAKELTFFADKIPARDAERMGLVNCVVRRDELEELVVSWAARLASGPATALLLTMAMLNGAYALSFSEAVEQESRAQTVATAPATRRSSRPPTTVEP